MSTMLYNLQQKACGRKEKANIKRQPFDGRQCSHCTGGKMTADSGVLTDLMVEIITATILMTYETHGSSNDSYDLPNTYCDSLTPRWPPMTLYPDIYTQQSPPHTQNRATLYNQ